MDAVVDVVDVIGDIVMSSFLFTPRRPVPAVHSHLETAKKKKRKEQPY